MAKSTGDERLTLKYLLGDKYNPKQVEFIKAPEFEVSWVGGIGAGKTFAMCIDAFKHAATFSRAKVLMGRRTIEELYRNPKPAFFEIMKKKGLVPFFSHPKTWDYREGTNYCRLITGAEIIFSNLDDADKFKNIEYTSVYVDQLEEIDFDVYDMLLLRCRSSHVPPQHRHVKSAANDEGDNWVRKRFLTYEPPHVRSTEPLAQRKLIRGNSFENPHLDPGAVAQLKAMTASKQSRYVFANMDGQSSDVLPKLIVVPPIAIPAHWPRWVGVDPARSTGITCAEWVTVNPDKEKHGPILPNAPHFYKEYWSEDREAETHAVAIMNNENRRVQKIVMDASSWAGTIKSNKYGTLSVADLYVRAGLPCTPSTGDQWTRVLLFLEASRRGMTVSEDCRNLIRQAPQYRTDDLQQRRIVAKARYHAVDAGGYALSHLPIRASALDLRILGPAYEIQTTDPTSVAHWERELSMLPFRKGRESLVTPGLDEEELHREGLETEAMDSKRTPEEADAW
jgi:hypothetical protein